MKEIFFYLIKRVYVNIDPQLYHSSHQFRYFKLSQSVAFQTHSFVSLWRLCVLWMDGIVDRWHSVLSIHDPFRQTVLIMITMVTKGGVRHFKTIVL